MSEEPQRRRRHSWHWNTRTGGCFNQARVVPESGTHYGDVESSNATPLGYHR
jgi:hypothetical protein